LNGRRFLVENCSWVLVRLATEVADARGATDRASVGARSVAHAKVTGFVLRVRVKVRGRFSGGKPETWTCLASGLTKNRKTRVPVRFERSILSR
jgi:hypothetical protein